MDFTLDNEQTALRDAVREMVGRRESTPESSAIGKISHDAELWKAFAEMGLPGLPFSEEAGGMGAGPVEVMLVAEELGRAGVQSAYVDVLLAGWAIAATGAPEGKELLGAISDGSALVVPALAEPKHAWSLEAAAVTAEQNGDVWRLKGTKEPVQYAEAATHLVTTARVGEQTGLFLVEDPPVDGARVAFAETPGILLGSLDDAAGALATATNQATVALLSEALGAMAAATTLTVDYLKTRKQFGVPLATFQALTHRAADLYVALELARSTVQYAAMTMAEDPGDSATVSRAKVVLGRTGRLIAQEAIQLHGGIGMTAEYTVGHLSTRLTAIEHIFGDTRQHLTSLAAGLEDHEAVVVL